MHTMIFLKFQINLFFSSLKALLFTLWDRTPKEQHRRQRLFTYSYSNIQYCRGGSRILWGRGLNPVVDLWSWGAQPPEAIGYLVFEVSKSKVQSTFDRFLKEANKMHVLLNEEVWWVQHLKGISRLFAAASQNLKPVWFLPKSKSTCRFLKMAI